MAFRGKVALVTGAASGMGQLAAWRLAAGDATVVAVDVNEEGLGRTARRAPNVHTHVCDVCDHAGFETLVKEAEAEHGPIDRVMNAAAIAPAGLLLEQPFEEISRLIEINYLGLVTVTKTILPLMIERGRGDLVQFGSLAGWVPSQRLGAYSAAKAAVVSFSETLYHETQGSGVRMVCVCPPPVATPMLDQIDGDGTGPRSLKDVPPIAPEEVLDAIEEGLESGRFLVFPGKGTTIVWRVRRFLPTVLWRRIDAAERLP
ncbi:MAG: SDR family oxidoreductase [Actinobacteria bacterium]|nr:SDR family oxidoreductase [Actinomycetota bacterium]